MLEADKQEKLTRQEDKTSWQDIDDKTSLQDKLTGKVTKHADKTGGQKKLTKHADKTGGQIKPKNKLTRQVKT